MAVLRRRSRRRWRKRLKGGRTERLKLRQENAGWELVFRFRRSWLTLPPVPARVSAIGDASGETDTYARRCSSTLPPPTAWRPCAAWRRAPWVSAMTGRTAGPTRRSAGMRVVTWLLDGGAIDGAVSPPDHGTAFEFAISADIPRWRSFSCPRRPGHRLHVELRRQKVSQPSSMRCSTAVRRS